jgi:hypothetical protein
MPRLGIDALRKIEQLNMLAEKVGVIVSSDDNRSTYGFPYTDDVCLCIPRDESIMPVYRRDTILFRGDVEDCIAWLKGYMAHTEYMRHLGFSDRMMEEAEEKYRQSLEHERLIHAIKHGKDLGIRREDNAPDDIPF